MKTTIMDCLLNQTLELRHAEMIGSQVRQAKLVLCSGQMHAQLSKYRRRLNGIRAGRGSGPH
jgi:hypothetical protein